MYFAGLDLGSSMTKAVILNEKKEVVGSSMAAGKTDFDQAALQVLSECCRQANIDRSQLSSTAVTGIGAKSISFPAKYITDISAQGIALYHLFPTTRTVIDVGGQSTKVLKIDDRGSSLTFVVSEKCATGSARFMQIIARVLQIDVEEIGPLSLNGSDPIAFSTGCAVFAESDVITRIAEGESVENILAGMNIAIAGKIDNLVKRVGLEPDCAVVGGGSRNTGLVKALEDRLNIKIIAPQFPHLTGAIGAALAAVNGAQTG